MINIDIMKKEHLDQIVEVEKECFSTPWSKQSFVEEIENNHLACYFVALDQNEVIGYIGMWSIVGEGHITNLGIKPSHRKMGIGTKLINEIINYSLINNIGSITLEVRESNDKAIELYKKFEFEVLGARKDYYTKPKEKALIMWKNL